MPALRRALALALVSRALHLVATALGIVQIILGDYGAAAVPIWTLLAFVLGFVRRQRELPPLFAGIALRYECIYIAYLACATAYSHSLRFLEPLLVNCLILGLLCADSGCCANRERILEEMRLVLTQELRIFTTSAALPVGAHKNTAHVVCGGLPGTRTSAPHIVDPPLPANASECYSSTSQRSQEL